VDDVLVSAGSLWPVRTLAPSPSWVRPKRWYLSCEQYCFSIFVRWNIWQISSKNQLKTTLDKKHRFFQNFPNYKKLGSESTDFLFRFFIFFENVADFIPFLRKRNAMELHFQIFHKNISQNWKKFATKENVGSYPPQRSSNSGIAYPSNRRFCLGGNFPKFRP